jgi:pilus assembly protein Flp/PilA
MLQMLASQLQKRQEGQGLIEYALIVLLIAIVVIVILGLVGGQVQNVFNNIFQGLGG